MSVDALCLSLFHSIVLLEEKSIIPILRGFSEGLLIEEVTSNLGLFRIFQGIPFSWIDQMTVLSLNFSLKTSNYWINDHNGSSSMSSFGSAPWESNSILLQYRQSLFLLSADIWHKVMPYSWGIWCTVSQEVPASLERELTHTYYNMANELRKCYAQEPIMANCLGGL